ncbi:MAG: ComF family protein [Dehalococcoidia bacterium]
MISINPQKIAGDWDEGFVLDLHTISSTLVGYDEFGHEVFDTKRSELGELLYRLKYQSDKSGLNDILDCVVEFLRKKWKIIDSLDFIVPMPPSNTRRHSQPVIDLASGISDRTEIILARNLIIKTKETTQLKNVYSYRERIDILQNAFEVKKSIAKGKTLLLLDDLYRSGATLNVALFKYIVA